ncbi:MAG TPA: hypothetical protein VKA54_12075 [Gemmatimonadaceae bacterium]|nr:hypothetical protein [Gemmatimonadaceae bacterium]
MISTRDLDELPDIVSLRRLTRSLAMLDALAAVYRHEPLTAALIGRLNGGLWLVIFRSHHRGIADAQAR